MLQSRVVFEKRLPSVRSILKAYPERQVVLIYDRKLGRHFPQWIKSFPISLAVTAGENLKTLTSLEKVVQHILGRSQGSKLVLVSVGGGSVTDFVGFVGSTLHRGTPVLHFPSTWLAALDSAHGGKTALNVGSYKNQLGTYWAADKVYVVRELLWTQPRARLMELTGELIKTSLLRGDSLWKKSNWEDDPEVIWRYLPEAIRFKQQVVRKDPFEKKGLRFILNFGHTLGHVFELSQKLPHGEAVRLGLCFDLEWSGHRGLLSPRVLRQMQNQSWWKKRADHREALRKLRSPEEFLRLDKKNVARGLRHTFLKAPGKFVIETVSLDCVLEEIRRQGGQR